MKRRLQTLLAVSSMLIVAMATFVAAPASAATAIGGHLVDEVDPTIDAAGMTVQLWSNSGGSPGSVLTTDVTGPGGFFSLDPGTSNGAYFIHVVPGRWQGGWVGESGNLTFAQNGAANATRYSPGDTIGQILDPAAFMHGYVVNPANGNRLSGVHVTARSSTDLSQVEAAGDTNGRGVFDISPITCEDDCYLKVNGSAIGFETGFLSCTHTVVQTFGEACAAGPGYVGKVKLDKL
jgi:hypothetical protein